MRRSRRIALVLAAGAVAVTPSMASADATAELTEPPAAVAEWFASEAGSIAREVLVDGAERLDRIENRRYSAGVPVELHEWNDEFLDGESDVVAAATGLWVAPLFSGGEVVGTIAGRWDGASVSFVYLDDDSVAGRGLQDGVSGAVIRDPQLGGLVEVSEDGEATGLSEVPQSLLREGVAEDDLRESVLEAYAVTAGGDSGAGSGVVDAGGTTGARSFVAPALGVLVMCIGVLVWFGRDFPWRRGRLRLGSGA